MFPAILLLPLLLSILASSVGAAPFYYGSSSSAASSVPCRMHALECVAILLRALAGICEGRLRFSSRKTVSTKSGFLLRFPKSDLALIDNKEIITLNLGRPRASPRLINTPEQRTREARHSELGSKGLRALTSPGSMHSRSTGVATEACIVQFALPARANYAKHSRPLLYGMPNCSSNSRPTVYASFHNCHGFYQVVNLEITCQLANSRLLCLWFWSLGCVISKKALANTQPFLRSAWTPGRRRP